MNRPVCACGADAFIAIRVNGERTFVCGTCLKRLEKESKASINNSKGESKSQVTNSKDDFKDSLKDVLDEYCSKPKSYTNK